MLLCLCFSWPLGWSGFIKVIYPLWIASGLDRGKPLYIIKDIEIEIVPCVHSNNSTPWTDKQKQRWGSKENLGHKTKDSQCCRISGKMKSSPCDRIGGTSVFWGDFFVFCCFFLIMKEVLQHRSVTRLFDFHAGGRKQCKQDTWLPILLWYMLSFQGQMRELKYVN